MSKPNKNTNNVCRNGVNCTDLNCPFAHPEGRAFLNPSVVAVPNPSSSGPRRPSQTPPPSSSQERGRTGGNHRDASRTPPPPLPKEPRPNVHHGSPANQSTPGDKKTQSSSSSKDDSRPLKNSNPPTTPANRGPCPLGMVCDNLACALQHPPERETFLRASSVNIPPNDNTTDKTKPSSTTECRYGDKCKNVKCTFFHPNRPSFNTSHSPSSPKLVISDRCSMGIHCPFSDCTLIHPGDTKVPSSDKVTNPKRAADCSKKGKCDDPMCPKLHPLKAIDTVLQSTKPPEWIVPVFTELLKAQANHYAVLRKARDEVEKLKVKILLADDENETRLLNGKVKAAQAEVAELYAQLHSFKDALRQVMKFINNVEESGILSTYAKENLTPAATDDAATKARKITLKKLNPVHLARRRIHREIYRLQSALPALALRQEIEENYKKANCMVIQGATGSGKSTQITQFIAEVLSMDAALAELKELLNGTNASSSSSTANPVRVLCTQPRKVSATSLAFRVAFEWAANKPQYSSAVGGAVGYQVSDLRKASKDTLIEYLTEGTLLATLLGESKKNDSNASNTTNSSSSSSATNALRDVAAIVLDEAHERSVNLDILIGLLRTGQQDGRWPHLKLIVTSATIDTKLFANYLAHPKAQTPAPILSIPGRMFPVQIVYRPYNSNGLLGGGEGGHVNAAVRLAVDIHRDTPLTSGDILVFLTGSDEVENAVEMFKKAVAHAKGNVKPTQVLGLYGRQQPEEQEPIFAKPPVGIRKVVFSTDVAETGVTIDGICHVVDTGLAKEMVFDERRKVSVLETRPISKSSAEQRKGRAGRTAPGTCYRLYSQDDVAAMRNSQLAEVLARPLELTVATLFAMGLDPVTFPWIEAPNKEALLSAVTDLHRLRALEQSSDGKSRSTALGHLIAQLQIDPSLARLLYLGCKEGSGEVAATLAGLLTVSSTLLYRPGVNDTEGRTNAAKAHSKFYNNNNQGDMVMLYRIYEGYMNVLEGKDNTGNNTKGNTDHDDDADSTDGNGSVSNAGSVHSDNRSTVSDNDNEEISYSVSENEEDGNNDGSNISLPGADVVDSDNDEDTKNDVAASEKIRIAAEEEERSRRFTKIANSKAAKAWCRTNYINAKSLGMAITASRDFTRAAKAVGIWTTDNDQKKKLDDAGIQRLFARSYFLNIARLAVADKADECEYHILRTSRNQTAIPHPSSSMSGVARKLIATHVDQNTDYKFDSKDLPQWVVFQSVLHTARAWLMVVTPVNSVDIIDYPPFKDEVIQRASVLNSSRIHIPHLATSVLMKLCGKNYRQTDKLEDALGKDVDVSVDGDNGNLTIWCPSNQETQIRHTLQELINEARIATREEVQEELYSGSARVVYKAGGEIDQVLFGDEYITINISNLPAKCKERELRAILQPFGTVRTIDVVETGRDKPAVPKAPKKSNESITKSSNVATTDDEDNASTFSQDTAIDESSHARVGFAQPDQAKRALENLNGTKFANRTIFITPGGIRSDNVNGLSLQSRVTLAFAAGKSTQSATLKFNNMNTANAVIINIRRSHAGINIAAIGHYSNQPSTQKQPHLIDSNGVFTYDNNNRDNNRRFMPSSPVAKEPYTVRMNGLPVTADEDDVLSMLRMAGIPGPSLPTSTVVNRTTGKQSHAPLSNPEDDPDIAAEMKKLLALLPYNELIDTPHVKAYFAPGNNTKVIVRVPYRGEANEQFEDIRRRWNDLIATTPVTVYDQRVRFDIHHSLTMFMPSLLRKLLRSQFAMIQTNASSQGATLTEKVPTNVANANRTMITISSPNRSVLANIQKQIVTLIAGTTYVPLDTSLNKRLLFSRQVRPRVEALNNALSTTPPPTSTNSNINVRNNNNNTTTSSPNSYFIQVDFPNQRFLIFSSNSTGTKAGCAALDNLLTEVTKNTKTETFTLKKEGRRNFMKGRDKFVLTHNLHDAEFIGSKLRITGTDEAIAVATKALKDRVLKDGETETVRNNNTTTSHSNDNLCLVCFDPMHDPSEASICGHTVCIACRENEFNDVNTGNIDANRFPLRCRISTDLSCTALVSWSDIDSLLSTEGLNFLKIRSLERYLLNNQTRTRHCFNGSCNGLLDLRSIRTPADVDEERRIGGHTVQCTECNVKYCFNCSNRHDRPISNHVGYTCNHADLLLDTGVEYHYHQITGQVIPLKCPVCKNHFDDFDGCFNVTCTYPMCGAAICGWCVGPSHSGGAYSCSLASRYQSTYVPPGGKLFTEVQRRRKEEEVIDYLHNIADVTLRRNVIAVCRKTFDVMRFTNIPSDL